MISLSWPSYRYIYTKYFVYMRLGLDRKNAPIISSDTKTLYEKTQRTLRVIGLNYEEPPYLLLHSQVYLASGSESQSFISK